MGYLVLGHCATYVLALALVPYLLYTVGVAAFGIITLAQTVVGYLILVVEFGFNLSATQSAARILQEGATAQVQLQKLFSRVFTARLFLLGLAAIILAVLIAAVPLYRSEITLFVLTFLQLVGHALYPLWLFQGAENMRLISILNVAARLFFFSVVFAVVRSPDDYLWVPALYSLGFITTAGLGLVLAVRRFDLRIALASWQDVKHELKSNLVLFYSNLSLNVYAYAPTVLAGFFLTRLDLGYYAIAERIITALRHIISAIAQAVLPVSSRLSKTSHGAMRSFVKRAAFIYTSLVLVGCGLLFVLAPWVVSLLAPEPMPVVVDVLRLMCWIPALFVVSFTFSHVLIIYAHRASYLSATVVALVASILLSVSFASLWGIMGIAWAALVTEVVLMLACIVFLEVKHRPHGLFAPSAITPS